MAEATQRGSFWKKVIVDFSRNFVGDWTEEELFETVRLFNATAREDLEKRHEYLSRFFYAYAIDHFFIEGLGRFESERLNDMKIRDAKFDELEQERVRNDEFVRRGFNLGGPLNDFLKQTENLPPVIRKRVIVPDKLLGFDVNRIFVLSRFLERPAGMCACVAKQEVWRSSDYIEIRQIENISLLELGENLFSLHISVF
ncbi:hypothetical protein C0584_01900 [Candidatus Parcubacteria bacterium]|nr:MAG: hypothetical protein C0584_01900 [Candidatus Parcubacteria bacterium]